MNIKTNENTVVLMKSLFLFSKQRLQWFDQNERYLETATNVTT